PWERAEPVDIALAITGVAPPPDLFEAGRLDPALAPRLGDAVDAPILLPRLHDRPEDIRAILTARLAREGLRGTGAPVGIDAAAFARIVEQPVAGEDAEPGSIVRRLVAYCAGEVVRAADVDALGLQAIEAPPSRKGIRG